MAEKKTKVEFHTTCSLLTECTGLMHKATWHVAGLDERYTVKLQNITNKR